MEDADLAAGAFNFELSAADGAPMPASENATNAADGTISFGDISYSTPGTYKYKIKEIAGSATYFEYDSTEKEVIVEVTDNQDGTLIAAVTGDGDDATFTNIYKAGSDEVFINAVKNVNGAAASQNIFEFTLTTDDGGALPDETTVTNNGGSVTFGPIRYDAGIFDGAAPGAGPDEPGMVSLTFSPDAGIGGDIIYAVPYLNGVPRDDLRAEIRKDDAGAWEPYTWTGLPNKDAAGEIAFEVYYTVDEDTTPVRASGLMLQLRRIKIFHYTITEAVGSAPGYTYDGHSETVTVTVTDNGNGTLATSVAYDADGAVFSNTYEASGEVTITADKVLKGAELAADQFEFGLFEGDTQVGDAVRNDQDGKITFTVPYSVNAVKNDVGTHSYTIREMVGTPQTGYSYDSSPKTVTVEVTDNGDGTLKAEVTYGGDMTFTNTYKPLPTDVTLEAEKVLEGRTLVAGEFSFRLEDENGNVVSSGTNDASGKIVFSAVPLTEAGTYTFTAYEVKGSAAGVTYDSTKSVYKVVVEDDGGRLVVREISTEDGGTVVFKNSYKKDPAAPETGDPNHIVPWSLLMAAAGAGILTAALIGRRKRKGRR